MRSPTPEQYRRMTPTRLPVSPIIGSGGPIGISLHMLIVLPPTAGKVGPPPFTGLPAQMTAALARPLSAVPSIDPLKGSRDTRERFMTSDSDEHCLKAVSTESSPLKHAGAAFSVAATYVGYKEAPIVSVRGTQSLCIFTEGNAGLRFDEIRGQRHWLNCPTAASNDIG